MLSYASLQRTGTTNHFLIVHLPFALKDAMQEIDFFFFFLGALNYLRIELGPTNHRYRSQTFVDFLLCVWHCARTLEPGLPRPQGKAEEPSAG